MNELFKHTHTSRPSNTQACGSDKESQNERVAVVWAWVMQYVLIMTLRTGWEADELQAGVDRLSAQLTTISPFRVDTHTHSFSTRNLPPRQIFEDIGSFLWFCRFLPHLDDGKCQHLVIQPMIRELEKKASFFLKFSFFSFVSSYRTKGIEQREEREKRFECLHKLIMRCLQATRRSSSWQPASSCVLGRSSRSGGAHSVSLFCIYSATVDPSRRFPPLGNTAHCASKSIVCQWQRLRPRRRGIETECVTQS